MDQSDLSTYIYALSGLYEPAVTAQETTHWFTTAEVHEVIKSINPGVKVNIEQAHDALLLAGYYYQPQPGTQSLNLKWMFKLK